MGDWGDLFGTGFNWASGSDWSSGGWSEAIGDIFGSSGGDSGGSWGNFFSNLMDGFSGNGSDGNIWGQILAGGINGYANAKLGEKEIKAMGEEQRKTALLQAEQGRKTSAFEAELLDYYKQKDKARKRAALDTYGQFSTVKNWAPNYTPAPGIQVPTKPTA